MSMLSAQCDELRAMAESVGLAMPQAATLMMDAADTITELRGALQVASVDYRHLQAENAKLRELVRHLYEYRQLYFNTGIYPTDHGVTEQRMRELGIEVER